MRPKFKLEDIDWQKVEVPKILGAYEFKYENRLYEERTFCGPHPACPCENDQCECNIECWP